MAELTIREVEPEVLAKLEERAQMHRRSVEEEHKAILREALLSGNGRSAQMSFEQYLRTMPNVGTDADFDRIEGSIRDIDLAS